jgi:Chain length determinant protein
VAERTGAGHQLELAAVAGLAYDARAVSRRAPCLLLVGGNRQKREIGGRESMALEESTSQEWNISLASMLNIVWRRRIFVVGLPLLGLLAGLIYGQVVTPLYLATATVRPGITAFTPDGGGAREWRMKDITHWYDNRLYEEGLAQQLGIARADAPEIMSHFILRGLQNIQGGNIITLTVLDPDPHRATRVLDASIDAFSAYATKDSLSNSIALTERGLNIRIAELRRQQRELDEKEDRLASSIALAMAESLRIDAKVAGLESSIAQIETENEQIEGQLQSKTELRGQVAKRLAELDAAIELAGRRARVGEAANRAPEGVRPQALISETEVYRGLVVNSVAVQDRIAEIDEELGQLRQSGSANRVIVGELRTEVASEVALDRATVADKLLQLRIDRSQGLDSQRQSLDLQMQEKQAQRSMLSPIERVGSIVASERPVRPRKKRATLILTFLGLLGGFAMSFVSDYVIKHRREIFAG